MRLVDFFLKEAEAGGITVSLIAPLAINSLVKRFENFSALQSEDSQILSYQNIAPCIACMECEESGVCVFDDGLNEIQELAREVDAILWISPLYFASVPAQLKALIDRGQALYHRRMLEPSIPKAERKKAWLALLGGGGDPYGYLAAVPPLSYASRMMDAELEPELVLIGPDREGDIDSEVFESYKESAINFFSRIVAELGA